MKRSPWRGVWGIGVVLLVSGFAGAVFGAQAPAGKDRDVDNAIKNFSSVLGLIEENYVDKLDSDSAVYGAIAGMLRTLDPHSTFFDPKAFASTREDQRGKYYGLGITVTNRFGNVTVISPPFAGSPAERAGLRVGDVISQINDESAQGMELNDVISRLKGPRGTSVKITIRRPGADEPIEMSVIRDEIAKFTISSAFYVRPGIGYIKLDSFAETSGAELREALRKLDPSKLAGLIFDLRNNRGGVLPAAIEIGESFLQRGQVILETRGRLRGSNKVYSSQKTNAENLFPLVVLINGDSASASEIVAGAIQDHDRGLVIGQTSFGKGLVQSVFELTKHAGLALTTQKWYTPSGRLIQRDYSQISQFDYYNHRETPAKKEDIKHSDTGRIVYGGGGITPDYVVEDPKSNAFQQLLARRPVFYTYVRELLAKNPGIDASFKVTANHLDDFKQHLNKRGVQFAEKDFQDNLDFVKRLIRYEVLYDKFGVAEANRSLLDSDVQVLKALELMPESKDLASKARRQVADRR